MRATDRHLTPLGHVDEESWADDVQQRLRAQTDSYVRDKLACKLKICCLLQLVTHQRIP